MVIDYKLLEEAEGPVPSRDLVWILEYVGISPEAYRSWFIVSV